MNLRLEETRVMAILERDNYFTKIIREKENEWDRISGLKVQDESKHQIIK